ncbi:MAG TPA: hypothetical protein VEI08_02530 [Candidatus Bathyarchaeia archaeon]|nr:hypothetical protein [Candidatus Bathyarchaeia archaeon]
MPCSFDFDWKNRIIRVRFHGRVADDDLSEMYAVGYKLVFRTQPRAGLVDLSAVASFEVSPESIRQLAKSAPMMPDPSLSRVIIAPSREMYAFASSFEMQTQESRPNLFIVRTEGEALTIFGVPHFRFEPLEPD